MAVTNESTPKAAPDSAKLQGMMHPVVTVTKGRKGAGAGIMAGKKGLTVDDIMSLHDSLPRLHGSGIYTFEVYDEAGDGKEKDKWTVQLGAVEKDFDLTMPAVPTNGQQPTFEGAKQIGPGLWFNETFGVLINRLGEMHPWRPGTPLPGSFGPPPPPPQAAPTTPWGMPGAPGIFPPWGQYPAIGADDEKTKMLERQLGEEREARKEGERRQEMADLRSTLEKTQQANDLRFEKLITAITEKKPDGPSSTEREMQARLDASERRADEARREVEAQRREDSIRREIESGKAETQRLLAEISANKSDPMVSMLTQMMANTQASTSTIVTAMQEGARSSAESAREYSRLMTERLGASSMTPERMVEMIKLAKDNGPAAEANKGLAEMYSTVFGMAKDLLVLRSEMDSGGEPPWVGIARDGVQRIGAVAQAFATTKAREEVRAEQAALQAQQRRQVEINRRRAEMATAAAGARAPRMNAAAPHQAVAAVDTRTESQKIRDAAAERKFPTAKNPASSEREAAAAALGMDERRQEAPPVDVPAPAQRPATTRPAARAVRSAPTLVEPDAVLTPTPSGAPVVLTAEDMTEDEVWTTVEHFDDPGFFGSAYEHVVQLRHEVAGGLDVDRTADFVLQAVQLLMGGNEFPPAMELLHNGHIAVMVERLLPDATPEYRERLADKLHEIGDEAEDEAAAS